MIRKKKGDLEWLEFELLSNIPEIVHGVFLRHGGESMGQFGSLNVLNRVGDDEEHIKANKKRILDVLQLDQLVTAHQVHGSNITHVEMFKEEFPSTDGLMTSRTNVALMTRHADCQAALFYDPVRKAIATVHAGWKGQAQNIYQKTIQNMSRTFGTHPKDLLVCISPSLGPQNSEFINYRTELPEEFWKFQIKPTYFDLWAISRHQLESCGVEPHKIEIAEIDTYANPSDFFSYRREKAAGRTTSITGGHGTVIGLVF